jgi:hypothetical protein
MNSIWTLPDAGMFTVHCFRLLPFFKKKFGKEYHFLARLGLAATKRLQKLDQIV